MNNFTGTLNVFELNGESIGQIVIINGKAIKSKENESLAVLENTINLYYKSKNITNKLPECNSPSYQLITTDSYVDTYNQCHTASGVYLGTFFVKTEYLGRSYSYMSVPYACDEAGDPYHILQRQTSYRNFTLEDLIAYDGLDPCPRDVFKNLLIGTTNSKIVDMLNKLNADFSKYNVNVISGDALGKPAISTSNTPFIYTTTISKSLYTSGTKLFKAANLLHEMVHVYFMSIVDDYKASGNSPRDYNINNFPSLFQAYCDKKYPPSLNTVANAHHLEMANQYVDAIASALQEYQTGIAVPAGVQPNQVYTDLAWGGLIEAPVYYEKFTPGSADDTRIRNRYSCEQIGRNVGEGTPFAQITIGNPCN